jgi:DNA-binding MarR family transcriptional regulator
MFVIAHIGNIPVEEYAGFIVPVIALYAYGRAWSRRRRRRVASLPSSSEALDERTTELVLARWAAADHESPGREQLALMYPPGPDGTTATELAERIGADPASVGRRLEDLADLGYVEYDGDERDGADGADERRAWLTAEGIHLLNITEDALLAAREGSPAGTGEAAIVRR